MIVAYARNFAASDYVRAVAKLSTGQVLATLIPLAAAPVLGRLYLPADYGALAAYMAIASVLGAVSTLQFQQAIIAEASERNAVALVGVCGWSSALIGLAALVAVAAFYGLRGASSILGAWMWLLPASAVVSGIVTAIAALANRRRHYGFMARLQVAAVAATVAISMVMGALRFSVDGLLTAYVAGQAVTLLGYLRLYRTLAAGAPGSSSLRRLALARRHRRFAIYTLPAGFVETVNLQFPVFVLSALGAVSLLGDFNRAQRLVGAPLTLLGASIGQVFRQRASEQYRQTGNCRRIFVRTFLVLVGFGLPPMALLMFIAPTLFRIVLGSNWTQAGEIARILAPMLLLRFVCSPLTSVFYFTHAQRPDFLLTLGGAAVSAICMLVPVLVGADPIWVVYGYAAAYAIIYLVFLIVSWVLAQGRRIV